MAKNDRFIVLSLGDDDAAFKVETMAGECSA